MPLENLAGNHYKPDEMKKVRDLLVQIQSILEPRFANLSEEERSKYGSINEKNKLVVNKVKDYLDAEPELCSDEIDWTEFMLDYNDRAFLAAAIYTMQRMIQGMENTKILGDYDNFRAAIRDYAYARFRNDGNDPRFEKKVKELSQFFAKGGSSNEEEDGEASSDTPDSQKPE